MIMSNLPRVEKTEKKYHHFHLKIPVELLDRMIEQGGVVYGEGTEWILDAIERKLEQISKEGA